MSLSRLPVELRATLKAAGAPCDNSMDAILLTAIQFVKDHTKPVENIDAHSSGPQFDVNTGSLYVGDKPEGLYVGFKPVAKPKRIKKLP